MPFVTVSEIKDISEKALRAHGAKEWIAKSVALAIANSESYGNIICGLYYLESYCLQLESGRVNGTIDPQVSIPRPGSILVDAKYGFAQAAFECALPEAIKAAQTNGTASLSVAHSHTCTSLGYFTSQFATAGLLAIGFTNASAIVAPPGGNKKVIGTNPVAMSVPDGQGGLSVHFDFSTSAVALGKITMAKAAGEKIPLGWAVDSEGIPTTDPESALLGSLVSAGDYKGWGLGVLVEILAAFRLLYILTPNKLSSGFPSLSSARWLSKYFSISVMVLIKVFFWYLHELFNIGFILFFITFSIIQFNCFLSWNNKFHKLK